jgi:hypothetical protein
MGWTAIFDVINKILPSREERIRTQINEIKKEMLKLQSDNATVANTRKYAELSSKLKELEAKLQNR